MLFNEVLGQEHLKKHLQHTVQTGRVAHAQLFVGPEGCGLLPMAIAYAQLLLCGTNEAENSQCYKISAQLTHPDLHFVFPVAKIDRPDKPLNHQTQYVVTIF